MGPKNRAKLMISKLSSEDQNFTDQLNALTSWDNSSNNEVNSTVKKIIDDVIQNGDQSVLDYTQKFDSVDAGSISELVISKERLKQSFDNLDEEVMIMKGSSENIKITFQED